MTDRIQLFAIAILLAASLFIERANAQQQLIINQEVQCDLQGSMSIDSSGNILVEVQDLATCVNESGGLAISPLVVQPSTVAPGDSFTAVWASSGAVSCAFNLPTGWNVPTVGLSGSQTIAVPSATSADAYTISITCEDATAQTVQADALVQVEDDIPDEPPAAPTIARTVLEGVAPGEIRLDWSSSSTATDCEATSTPSVPGWSGSVGTGQNQQTTLTGLAADSYSFALRCSNAAGNSPWESVSAVISSTSQCTGRQPPSGWARMGGAGTNSCYWEAGAGWQGNDCTVWQGGISSNRFVEETGNTHRLAVAGRPDPEQYMAIRFDTDGMSPGETGRLTQVVDGFADYADMIVTISSCPGDFHQSAVSQETGCYVKTNILNGTVISWGGTSSGRTCQLQSNQTYYLNMAPTSSVLGTDPDQFVTHPNCRRVGGQSNACGAAFQMQ